MNYLVKVAEFHKTFKHPILDEPQIPDKKRCELRIALLQKELNELKAAIEKNDIVECADAFCDLQYVLSGAILEFGLYKKFSVLFDEVHSSNMSKACRTEDEAKETVFTYGGEGVEAYYEKRDGKFFVLRSSDNKTLKSIKYSPADLKSILNK